MIPTYLRICSDVHFEQFRSRNLEKLELEYLPKDDRDVSSILILAGDISSDPDQLLNFIKLVEPRFARVLFVPGNHEFYRHDMTSWTSTMKSRFTETLMNTSFALDAVRVEQIGGVRFIFGTLWADGGETLLEQARVGLGLNDFRYIMLDNKRFTVPDMVQLHRAMKADIIRYLEEDPSKGSPDPMKNIVVTHHMPSRRLCHPRFGLSINGGFASDCDEILASDIAPDLWIHGHTHDRISAKLWGTRIECNPSGYHAEHNNGFTGGAPVFIDLSNLEVA